VLLIYFVSFATGEPIPGDLVQLLNYGFAGVMLTLFIWGKVHSDKDMQDLKDTNEKLLGALLNLQSSLGTQALPALNQAGQVLQQTLPQAEAALVTELRQILNQLQTQSAVPPKEGP
jgi:hypothetical protein